MFLDENLKKLNSRLAKDGLRFEKEEDKLRLIEETSYILNKLRLLKKELIEKYKLKFNYNEKYWYIGNEGIQILSKRELKLEPSIDIDVLKSKLREYIEMIDDGTLKECITKTLRNNEFFYDAPAATIHHHKYKHGLLEHTIQTLDLALAIIEKFGESMRIDKDLIIAGAILHDIGKINCYRFVEGGIDITSTFLEQEHIINGIKIVLQNFNIEKLDALIHIIASHHNIKEWGSPISPKSNEAWVIHFADDISSKLMG